MPLAAQGGMPPPFADGHPGGIGLTHQDSEIHI